MKTLKSFFSFPLHPIGAAYIPIFFIYTSNAGEFPLSDMSRIFFVAAVILAIFWTVGVFLIRRDHHNAALWASSGLLLFYTYGHFYQALLTWKFVTLPPKHSFVALLWLTVFLAITALLKLSGKSFKTLTPRINFLMLLWIGVLFLKTFPGNIFVYQHGSSDPSLKNTEVKPNIYHIILDGYSRSDVYLKNYGHDNTPFQKTLRESGFYIAEKSQSNYAFTLFSLASMLNMNYLEPTAAEKANPSKFGFKELQDNQAFRFLKKAGYRIVVFDGGYPPERRFTLTDEFFSRKSSSINIVEYFLIQSTALRLFFDVTALAQLIQGDYSQDFLTKAHRRRIRHILASLPYAARNKRPVYVFAHFLSPHPPFIFGPDGQEIGGRKSNDFFGITEGPEAFNRPYVGQSSFLEKEIPVMLHKLFLEDPGPKIIILHSDHGGYFISHANRMKILNAYYFFDGNYQSLYPTITPVNTFRLIFDQYLNTKAGLLEDHSYWSDLKDNKHFAYDEIPIPA